MLSILDIAIIIGYLATLIVIGYFSGRDNKDQEDYFLASRNMPWLPIALSVAATAISANGFIGGPGWAYTDGMFPFMVNVTIPLAILFALAVTTPVIFRMRVTSVYEYVEKRFGNFTKTLTILQFFINSLIQASSMVYIPVLLLEMITGWSFFVLVPLVVIVAIVYTLLGGIKAVIWTDALQMVVVFFAVIMVVITALEGIGLGLMDTMAVAAEAGKLKILDFTWDITVTNAFWATLIGGTFMWIRYFCFDQAQVQRVLTAKSLKSAKNSFVVSAIVMNVVYFLMLFVGVILYVYYDGKVFETSNEIMISFILYEMPIGIVGVIIAGVFAASMSSVDSILNSMATVFSKDVYEKYMNKGKTSSLAQSKYITIVIGVVITIFVMVGFNGSVKSVLDLVGSYISYFSGPATGAFLLAFFTKKANDKGTGVGFLIGLVLGFIIAKTYSVSWLWNPAIGAVITMVFGYILSGFFPGKPVEETLQYTALGMKHDLEKEAETHPENPQEDKSTRPFTFGWHEALVLVFFLGQYAVFMWMESL